MMAQVLAVDYDVINTMPRAERISAMGHKVVGMASIWEAAIFNRGYFNHTGFGLYLSREILSITGITITKNGTPGKGARFEITVPKVRGG